MEEWKECKFKDLYRIPSKNGLSKPSRVRGSGYKMINMGELFSNDRIYNIPMELVPLTDTEKENAKVEVNDLLFARQSLIVEGAGKCSIVMETDELTVFESHIIRVRLNPELAYPPFFYYYFKNKNSPIRAIIQHCVQAGIKASDLAEITVKVPPLPTQQKIAVILSSLDDKIELNNKINTNLQQQAQALFKNWFVDFEPFGGKMPEGWKVGKLSELINVKYGKDHKKLADGNYPVYGSGGIMRYVDKFLYDKESVLIPRKGTLNNVFYINEPFWSVDTMFYTEMKKENIAKYVYFFVKGKDLNSMNAGSAVPSMTTEILNAIEVVIPSDEYLEKFENIVSPMFKQIKQCIIENENLASIRDTLLPKLMNGEITVDKI